MAEPSPESSLLDCKLYYERRKNGLIAGRVDPPPPTIDGCKQILSWTDDCLAQIRDTKNEDDPESTALERLHRAVGSYFNTPRENAALGLKLSRGGHVFRRASAAERRLSLLVLDSARIQQTMESTWDSVQGHCDLNVHRGLVRLYPGVPKPSPHVFDIRTNSLDTSATGEARVRVLLPQAMCHPLLEPIFARYATTACNPLEDPVTACKDAAAGLRTDLSELGIPFQHCMEICDPWPALSAEKVARYEEPMTVLHMRGPTTQVPYTTIHAVPAAVACSQLPGEAWLDADRLAKSAIGYSAALPHDGAGPGISGHLVHSLTDPAVDPHTTFTHSSTGPLFASWTMQPLDIWDAETMMSFIDGMHQDPTPVESFTLTPFGEEMNPMTMTSDGWLPGRTNLLTAPAWGLPPDQSTLDLPEPSSQQFWFP